MEEHVEMIRRLMLAINRVDGAYYYFSKKMGMKVNTLTLLYALDDGKPHSQKQISQDWLVPKTTLNTNVKELAEAGYVTLCPEAGTREKTIALTKEGMELAEKLMEKLYEAEEIAMEKTIRRFSPEFVKAMEYFADDICNEFDRIPPAGGKEKAE